MWVRSELPVLLVRDADGPLPEPHGRPVSEGPGESQEGVIYALYRDAEGRDELARALQDWQNSGSTDSLLAMLPQQDRGERYGAYIFCADTPSNTGLGASAALEDIDGVAPDFTDVAEGLAGDCDGNPLDPARSLGPVRAHGAPELLVVGSTGDPATPYEWAAPFAAQFESAELLTRDGSGHLSYGRSDCINDAVDRYLIELVLPPVGTVCK